MLENLSALAIVPKAKGIGAQRLTLEEYRELMRRRSVLEVLTTLQSHPYLHQSLAGLAQTNLHRAQVEDALTKDIFFKYESLMRYSFRKNHFGGYFLVRCEISELLQKLRLMHMGLSEQYIIRLPGFLTTKTSFSLLKLAKAQTLAECVAATAGTPYSKLLQSVTPKAGYTFDYLACEHALESYYYQWVLQKIKEDLSGRTAAETKALFITQAEIYNLDLLFRTKAFYNAHFTPGQLRELLVPVYGVLSPKKMYELAGTRTLEDFLKLYNESRASAVYGVRNASPGDASDVREQRALYRQAERLLHFSCKPQTVLAAIMCMASLERSNIITIIEGVRYGLAPDKIEQFLKR